MHPTPPTTSPHTSDHPDRFLGAQFEQVKSRARAGGMGFLRVLDTGPNRRERAREAKVPKATKNPSAQKQPGNGPFWVGLYYMASTGPLMALEWGVLNPVKVSGYTCQ